VASINLIIAQRLARKLCDKCKVAQPPSADAQKRIQDAFVLFQPNEDFDMSVLNDPIMYSPRKEGCEHCDGRGYKGRIGIFEVMVLSEKLKKGILEGLPGFEIQKIARQEGMLTLEQDGLLKALQGLTSLEEVYKLIKN